MLLTSLLRANCKPLHHFGFQQAVGHLHGRHKFDMDSLSLRSPDWEGHVSVSSFDSTEEFVGCCDPPQQSSRFLRRRWNSVNSEDSNRSWPFRRRWSETSVERFYSLVGLLNLNGKNWCINTTFVILILSLFTCMHAACAHAWKHWHICVPLLCVRTTYSASNFYLNTSSLTSMLSRITVPYRINKMNFVDDRSYFG